MPKLNRTLFIFILWLVLPGISTAQSDVVVPSPATPEETSTPTPRPDLYNRDFFVEAEVDNTTPYVGQQVIYTFRLYRIARFFGQSDYESPAFTDFWGNIVLSQPQYRANRNGRTYLVNEVRSAIFPAKLGQITIESAELVIPGMLGPGQAMQTEQLIVDVQPLPDNTPASFHGAVGQYQIRASLNRTETEVNDPLTFVFEVEGWGNVDLLTEPSIPEMDSWRFFPSEATTTSHARQEGIYGTRRFERLILPTEAGQFTLPSIAYSYFDPMTDSYQTLQTEPVEITVKPSVSDATNGQRVVSNDIHPLKPISAELATVAPVNLMTDVRYWVGWLMPLGLLGLLVQLRRNWYRFKTDPVALRRKRAYHVAHKKLQFAPEQGSDALSLAHRTLLDYLADRFNKSTSGATHAQLLNLLETEQISSLISQHVLDLLRQIEHTRFSPIEAAHQQQVLEQIKQVVTEIEEASETPK